MDFIPIILVIIVGMIIVTLVGQLFGRSMD